MKYIRIQPTDNVGVALVALKKGETIEVDTHSLKLLSDVPAGHKFALCAIASDQDVIKYGFPIGHVLRDIQAGERIDEKNLRTNLSGVLDYTYEPTKPTALSGRMDYTFKGYKRANGDVGIRNEIWIIPTVGCVNGIVQSLAQQLRDETALRGVDAIVAFPHNYGCSQLGDDHENTRRILRDMVLHPNAGGVLVVGLGCENNQLSAFRELLGETDPDRVKFIETQQVADEFETGMLLLREIYDVVSGDQRESVPLSALRVGLKCGGSDGFSGITANPLLGAFSDFLVAEGGTTVLTEVPEMFGAETLLMNRCMNQHVFDKTVGMINDFKRYFMENKQPVYENPSPGNKAGGISTLEEKSLGCTQKSGCSVVRDVLPYGARLKKSGLNLLSAPGNDLVASTALAASGCQLILFTTGRGTPFGTFVPTVKISTNTALFERKPGWIDFDAGLLLGGYPMEELLADFVRYLLRVANGESVNAEKKNYREMAIFKTGVTL